MTIDSKTQELIFSANRRDKTVIDTFLQTPLTDMAEIIDRQDTIGGLVENDSLRFSLESMANYIEVGQQFSSVLSTRYLPLEQRIKTVKSIASTMAPSGLLDYTPGTEKLRELVSGYNSLMQGEFSVPVFKDYISELRDQLVSLENSKPKAPQKVVRHGFLRESVDQTNLTEEDFAGIVAIQKSHQFSNIFEKAKPFHDLASFYTFLGKIAKEGNYCKPTILPKESNCLIIEEGKYRRGNSRENLIPNSTFLDPNNRVEILEGVNAGGKTFDMIKSMYIAITALTGMWVPAKSATVSIRDRFVMREKGTGDTLSAMMQDCDHVLSCYPKEGEYWMVAMDETFTSTEKDGGAALTYGLVRSILDQGNSVLILSSHYPVLNSKLTIDGVNFNHFPFEETSEGVTFPHAKQTGSLNDYSYAIKVAKHHKFDEKIIGFAEQRLSK